MKRSKSCLLRALILVAAWQTPQLVLAQAPIVQPGRQLPPPISPYLNLLRPDSSFANNYYNLVRPQIDYGNSIYGLQQQVNGLNSLVATGIQGGAGLGPVTTGHPVQFMNFSNFYPGRTASMNGVNRPR
jgi:hypothetical protein